MASDEGAWEGRCGGGLLLVGLDLIGDYVTEINVTSPTCWSRRGRPRPGARRRAPPSRSLRCGDHSRARRARSVGWCCRRRGRRRRRGSGAARPRTTPATNLRSRPGGWGSPGGGRRTRRWSRARRCTRCRATRGIGWRSRRRR
ncbi:hypothetical protein DCC79_03125 [bacterium]|nr:MAG: hypothetical protein DCC79_03125 [bacterium]